MLSLPLSLSRMQYDQRQLCDIVCGIRPGKQEHIKPWEQQSEHRGTEVCNVKSVRLYVFLRVYVCGSRVCVGDKQMNTFGNKGSEGGMTLCVPPARR